MENKAEIKNQYITSQGRLYLLGVSYYLWILIFIII
jgi:hypothetical protein